MNAVNADAEASMVLPCPCLAVVVTESTPWVSRILYLKCFVFSVSLWSLSSCLLPLQVGWMGHLSVLVPVNTPCAHTRTQTCCVYRHLHSAKLLPCPLPFFFHIPFVLKLAFSVSHCTTNTANHYVKQLPALSQTSQSGYRVDYLSITPLDEDVIRKTSAEDADA